jgi:hypothetical protein
MLNKKTIIFYFVSFVTCCVLFFEGFLKYVSNQDWNFGVIHNFSDFTNVVEIYYFPPFYLMYKIFIISGALFLVSLTLFVYVDDYLPMEGRGD